MIMNSLSAVSELASGAFITLPILYWYVQYGHVKTREREALGALL